jgi:hypothetical protein
MGMLESDERRDARERLHLFAAGMLNVIGIVGADFERAAALADIHRLGLRGGDSLHLAVAERADLTLATLDKAQAAAGRALGLSTLLL